MPSGEEVPVIMQTRFLTFLFCGGAEDLLVRFANDFFFGEKEGKGNIGNMKNILSGGVAGYATNCGERCLRVRLSEGGLRTFGI